MRLKDDQSSRSKFLLIPERPQPRPFFGGRPSSRVGVRINKARLPLCIFSSVSEIAATLSASLRLKTFLASTTSSPPNVNPFHVEISSISSSNLLFNTFLFSHRYEAEFSKFTFRGSIV